MTNMVEMAGLSRRQFLTSGAATAVAGIVIGVPNDPNVPLQRSQLAQVQIPGITDTSKKPNSTHLGDNSVDISVHPKEIKPLKEFEFFFEMDSKMFDVSGAMGIGAFLNLYFYSDSKMESTDPKHIEIQPWAGTLADAVYIDPTKPSQNSNWTVDSIIDSEGNYLGSGNVDAESGLVKVHATQKNGGYEIEFSWTYVGEEYLDDGTTKDVEVPQSAKYLLPIPNIYGIVASVRDSRDFRGDADFTSLSPFGPTIQHLNHVGAVVAFTKLDTGQGSVFEPANCVINRSGSVHDAKINLGNEKYPDEQQNLHVLWIEPNAQDIDIARGIQVGPFGEGEYERTEIIDRDGRPMSTYVHSPTDGSGHIPTAIRHLEYEHNQPFAVTTELGTMDADRDFGNTVAIVRSSRELTWVAPTINGLSRCSDILDAVGLVEAHREKFPEVHFNGETANFTPIELFTGCNDLRSLEIFVFQEHTTGTGENKKYFTDAELRIFGDDIYSGRVRLPPEFDLDKPIEAMIGNYSRTLGFVREPYPVINPLIPVLCVPPPQSRV